MIFEKNRIIKNIKKNDIRFGLTYPNIYRTAMSSLGYEILYNFINLREDTYCERIIYPNSNSIETNTPLNQFNIISFTLQYEEDYFNLIEILKNNNIPLKRKDRKITDPLIIAGGPCVTSNPLPLSDFIDMFIIGEGEVVINKLIDCYKKNKKNLKLYLNIEGIYIPEYKNKTKIAIVKNLNNNYHITYPIISESENKENIPVFNKTIMLNVSRGCTRGCRFCMSSYLYRPVRETSLKTLIDISEKTRKNTGLNKITLIGAAVSDYSQINELIETLLKRGFEISTPSLRIESITKDYLKNLKKSGLKTITIAPESIPKLRKKLNKNIPDKKVFEVINNAVDLKFNLKFYFLIGIPGETDDDIKQLANYIKKIAKINNKYMKFSINPIIPKAHTPLQWMQYDYKDIKNKMRILKKELKNINVKYESPKKGMIQYILSCGDESISEVLLRNANKPLTLKEWKEFLPNYETYNEFPWKNINVNINKNFLKSENKKILLNNTTPWCNIDKCSNCGACN